MAKRKIPLKDLKELRKKFIEEKIDQNEIENGVRAAPVPTTVKIKEVKNTVSAIKESETGKTSTQRKKDRREEVRNLKKSYTNTQKIETSYGYDVGSIVCFNYKSNEEIGIVLNIRIQSKTKKEGAMKKDIVTLLSSVGRVKVHSSSIYEIIECN